MEDSTPTGSDSATIAELFSIDEVDFIGAKDSTNSSVLNQILSDLRKVGGPNSVCKTDQRPRDETKSAGYKLLLKIVENVLLHPWEHEKRRIREQNALYSRRIGNDDQMKAVLVALGFRSIHGYAVLQVVDVPLLRLAYRSLIAALQEEYSVSVKSLEGHFFDPFKAYRHSSDVNRNAYTDNFECVGKDLTKRQIDKLSDKLTSSVITSINEWNPQIHVDEGKLRPKITQKTSEPDVQEDKHAASHLKKIYDIGKCDFESASQKRLEALNRQCEQAEQKQTVELKIRLPATTVLTIHPPLKTPVATLKQEVQTLFVPGIAADDWELVEMPTRRVLDEHKTLLQQDIIHRVLLHFRRKGG
ncbi:hypothetical protein, conserved [Babesia bigemina]|uniref:PUB domain-containing protein n=1 Tax=Babesia bigemina TaxID=5866 RepID=A0A061DBT3_BABBI|nr:hypothetical protein, conserved [Babesia bigemina]CDR98033.1 hypothetical protein, conserved [Babesia bigemina]|eukprot:XP_012770219.1 hypothetical protein, conserved [Babesia bigemina]